MFATPTKNGCMASACENSSWRRKCLFAHGITPLYVASHAGHADTVKILLAAGADIDAVNTFDGATALWTAAQQGNLSVVSALLEYGADPYIAREDDGMTPLNTAIIQGHENIAARLIASRSKMKSPQSSPVSAGRQLE